jgi:HSP20 family protein
MDPFDKERRRKNPFDFIDDDDFERIFDEMQKIFESNDFREMVEDMLRGGVGSNKRFIHGFSVNMGPDGRPRIQEFGNRSMKTPGGEPMISEEQEPVTDVIEGDNEVYVTVELPGVEKDNIDLNVTENTLEITVNNPERKYHKSVDLPCGVQSKTTKATYKNGILDVVIPRKEKKKTGSGFKVNVE